MPQFQGQPLLGTKLYVPRSRQVLVDRPALAARLEQGEGCRLTLVSAPAGFGKTTTLAVWAAQTARPVAWLSLDEADNDLVRFLAYLTAALQTVDEHLGAPLLVALESLQPLEVGALLTGLLNEIDQIGRPLAFVLDDYHLVQLDAIHEAVRFLIENSPDSLHLIISTREDPPWPLARLRAGRQLNEIRGRDLRFSLAETIRFCNDVMGLHVTEAGAGILDAHAEGWAAGLQLAALSLQGTADMEGMLKRVSEGSRYVLDYLLEEVLNRQPPPVQDFLLRTAVLDRLCAPLCAALLAENGVDLAQAVRLAEERLAHLEAANLFIVPLDERRTWYRYHRLFAGLLRERLRQTAPEQIEPLHRCAAAWFHAQGLVEEAIGHALTAGAYDLAADLLEREGLDLVSRHKMLSLARWLEALPEALFDERPWLCIYMAYTRHWVGERKQALGARLDQAERALNNNPPQSDLEAQRIRGYIASLRGQNALSAGDLPQIIEQANLALALLPPGDLMGTEAGVSLGGAYWIQGDAPAAERAFAYGRDTAVRSGSFLMAVPTATYTGWQQMKQGRLQEALRSFEQALAWATSAAGQIDPVGGFPLLRISDLHQEWHDAPAALETARQGHELSLRLSQADVVVDAQATLAARLAEAGDVDGAWVEVRRGLAAAQDRRPDHFLVTRLDACRVRLWLAANDLASARAWLAEEGPDPDGALSYHHDLHHLLAARILLADDRPRAAGALALRVAEAAARAGWLHEQIQALSVAAAAAQELGQTAEALRLLRSALGLGARGCFITSLLQAGPLIPALLRKIEAGADLPQTYLSRVCAAAAGGQGTANLPQPLIEPLSERELEILALIAAGLTNQEIATRLVLSLATVKWHAGNIYGKLGVRNRGQAVAQARELGLLD